MDISLIFTVSFDVILANRSPHLHTKKMKKRKKNYSAVWFSYTPSLKNTQRNCEIHRSRRRKKKTKSVDKKNDAEIHTHTNYAKALNVKKKITKFRFPHLFFVCVHIQFGGLRDDVKLQQTT